MGYTPENTPNNEELEYHESGMEPIATPDQSPETHEEPVAQENIEADAPEAENPAFEPVQNDELPPLPQTEEGAHLASLLEQHSEDREISTDGIEVTEYEPVKNTEEEGEIAPEISEDNAESVERINALQEQLDRAVVADDEIAQERIKGEIQAELDDVTQRSAEQARTENTESSPAQEQEVDDKTEAHDDTEALENSEETEEAKFSGFESFHPSHHDKEDEGILRREKALEEKHPEILPVLQKLNNPNLSKEEFFDIAHKYYENYYDGSEPPREGMYESLSFDVQGAPGEKVRQFRVKWFESGRVEIGTSDHNTSELEMEAAKHPNTAEVLEETPTTTNEQEPEVVKLEVVSDTETPAANEESHEENPEEQQSAQPETQAAPEQEAANPEPEAAPEGLRGRFEGFAGHYSERVREKIEDLAPHARRFAEGIYARAKFNTSDKLQMFYSEKLIGYHNWRGQRQERNLGKINSEIAQLQRRMGNGPSIASRLGIPENPQMQQERDKRNREYSQKIEQLENKRASIQTRLENRNNYMAQHENNRNEVAREYRDAVAEQIRPIERKVEGLQSEKMQLDSEIEGMTSICRQFDQRIDELENALEDEFLLPEERRVVREAVNQARKDRKESNRLLRSRIKDRSKVERRMIPVTKKLNKWQDRESVAARITNRSTPYKNVGMRRRSRINEARTEIPVGETKDTPSAEISGEIPAASFAEEQESEVSMSVTEFASSWNKYFGSEIPVNVELFAQASAYKMEDADEEMLNREDVETTMQEYVDLLQSTRMNRKGSVDHNTLERNLRLFWQYTNLEEK